MPPHAENSTTKAGDLALLDFELWGEIGGRRELIDTTREDVARGAGIDVREGTTFGPRPHAIGGDYFPGPIETSLVGVAVGEDVSRDFEAADAFGERDPKLIELFSMHEIERLPEMRREDADLEVGTVLTIGNRRGRVVTLTQARVRVDFNPPYAGRKVHGAFKVVELLTDPEAQARAVVEMVYGRGKEFTVKVHQHVVSLRIPDRSKFDLAWFAAKPRVIERIRSTMKPKSIEIVEEYATPPEKEKGRGKAETASEKEGERAEAESPPTPKKTAKPAADAE